MRKVSDHEFLMEHEETDVRVWIDEALYLEVQRREKGGAYVSVRMKGREKPLREIWARAWSNGTVGTGDLQ